MFASVAPTLPTGDEWTYEVKWNGRAVSTAREASFVLDGEVVAVDTRGRPSFQALHHQKAHRVVYYAFGEDKAAADVRRE